MEPRNTTSIELYIESLGPIRNSQIVLKPFLVFSGESGTGKSYTALLVHYIYRVICKPSGLREFFNYLGASFDEHKKRIDGKEGILFQFNIQQLEEWISTSAIKYVGEMLGNFSLQGTVSIKFHGLDENYLFYYQKDEVEIGDNAEYFDRVTMNGKYTMRFRSDIDHWNSFPYEVITNHIFKMPQINTFLLPPSRGGLVCLNDIGRGDYKVSTAGMYNEFITDLGYLKSAKVEETLKATYQPISQSLINGKINIHDNELFFEQEYGEIPITAGAASIKELAPFAIMLQKGLVEQYAVMFEEPETNLHPELQIRVADTLVYLLQQGCRFQITTHSDYFLRRINDLIRLDVLKNKLTTEAYQELCHAHHYIPELTLDKRLIGAYYFKRTSETEVHIIHQEAGNGIPFDTFQSVLHNQLKDSSYIYDKMCESDETVD